MKLIIDIPEKVVTAIQNGEDYRYDIHTAIAQGIPISYEEKPKGEWIFLPIEKKYKCSSCSDTCRCDTFPIFRYCPWCGSDNLGNDE